MINHGVQPESMAKQPCIGVIVEEIVLLCIQLAKPMGELHPTSIVFSHFTSMARLTTLALGIMLGKPMTLLGVQLMLMLTGITKEVKGSGAPAVPIALFQRPLIGIPPRPQPLQRPAPPRP